MKEPRYICGPAASGKTAIALRFALELDLPHGDPFDRVIVATAITRAILVSPDSLCSRLLPDCDNAPPACRAY